MNDIDLYLLAIVAILLVWCIYKYLDKKYGVEFSKVAKRLKLKYMRHYDCDIEKTFKDFCFFTMGTQKSIDHVFYGEYEGYKIRIFNYTFKKEQQSHALRQTIAFFQLYDITISEFQLCPQKWAQHIGTTYGYQVVNFEHIPFFWSNHLLRALDQAKARLLFTKKVISHLAKLKNLCIESTGKQLIFFYYNKSIEPHKIRSFIEDGIRTLKILHHSAENIK